MTDLPLTIKDAAQMLRDGSMSSVELTEACFRRIEQLDPVLGTFIARFEDRAVEAAKAADVELGRSRVSEPLLGIPLGIKDIIATLEGPTTAQSLVHSREWWIGRDAPVVDRIRRAGGIIVGKTTTMEFAIGRPDAEKPFPIPRNPWDLARFPGGSSSGTGNGIASGQFLGGLGTDTGGSVRTPAAFCGITGLKVTYGLVPKSGCVPLAYSLDSIGPMAHTAYDCAILLSVMAGYDPDDPTTISGRTPDYLQGLVGNANGLRIGFDRDDLEANPIVSDAVRQAFDEAIVVLQRAGAELVPVRLEGVDELSAVQRITTASEAFAYHRNDLANRWEDYGAPTRHFLVQGATISSTEYIAAQLVRGQATRSVLDSLTGLDAYVTVSAPGIAPRLDEMSEYQRQRRLPLGAWNASGFPALSVPMGFDSGLPLSLQIVGPPTSDGVLLRIGDAYQRETSWHAHVAKPDPTSPSTVLPLPNSPEVPDQVSDQFVADAARAGVVVAADEAAVVAAGLELLRDARSLVLREAGFSTGEVPALIYRALIPD